MSSLELLLLDLDGTLLDHDGASKDAVERLLDEVGVAGPRRRRPEYSYAHWSGASQRSFERFVAGQISLEESRMERIAEFLDDGSLGEGDLRHLSDVYVEAYEVAWRPYPDVPRLVRGLEGVAFNVAVVTNGDHAQQQKKVAACALPSEWKLRSSSLYGVAKPDRRIFDAVLDEYSCAPGRALMVGDSLRADIQGAQGAGIRAFWLQRHGGGVDASAVGAEGGGADLDSLLDYLRAVQAI